MPHWEGIEDGGAEPTRVWLSRASNEDEWQPLRKADCHVLNSSSSSSSPTVYIEHGRSIANLKEHTIKSTFFQHNNNEAAAAPTLQLTSATWFVKIPTKQKHADFRLEPMSELDRHVVEHLYQQALLATSSLGSGMDKVLKETHVLQDDVNFQVSVSQINSNTFGMKKKSTGWFGPSFDLQRGWGPYVVEGEVEEELLGPVQHVVFVVHGIGEAMWSRDMKSYSIVQEVNRARIALHKMMVQEYTQTCEKARKEGEPDPPPPHRVELFPIEWYNQIHADSNALMTSLKSTTLTTIPALRAIANDVIFDVLMYMTAGFCHEVLETVSNQICFICTKYKEIHPTWDGTCGIMGHSLGSVIVWDLLSMLKEQKQQSNANLHGVEIDNNAANPSFGYQHASRHGHWGPTLPKPMKLSLPFEPDFTIFLGSPLGLFLTLRGAHAVFDEMRQTPTKGEMMDEEEVDANDFVSPFSLPSNSVYNIFHPSDPVAYRIEPLLLPQDEEMQQALTPEPVYLVKAGQNVRLHVKAMQLRKSIVDKTSSISEMMNLVTEQAVTALSKETTTNAESTTASKRSSKLKFKHKPNKFPLGGKSNRVDFMLQPGVIDNEYISAVTAHSSYFTSQDVLGLVLDLVMDNKTKKKEQPISDVKEETNSS